MNAAFLIEICAALCGVAGTWLLANKGPRAGWGFVAYLASNAGWIAFAWIHSHWGLLLQQIAFTVVSLYGIWTWILLPALDRAVDSVLDWEDPSAEEFEHCGCNGRCERGPAACPYPF